LEQFQLVIKFITRKYLISSPLPNSIYLISINTFEIKVGYVSRGFQGLAVTVNSTKQQLGKSAIVSMIGSIEAL
jgi:hypothetical protein